MPIEGSDPVPELDTRYHPAHVQNHVEACVDDLLEQFKSRPVFAAVLRAFVAQIQKLEDATWEVIVFRRLENAEGVVLDMLGAIVGRGRAGLDDPGYRIAIAAQIRIIKSGGRPEDLIAIALLSTPLGTLIRLIDEYPAGFRIDVGSQVTWPIEVLFLGGRAAKAAGVRFGLVYSTAPPGNWFKFSSTTSSETSSQHGFGNALDPSTGGVFRTIRV
jgi:hypothetical protein